MNKPISIVVVDDHALVRETLRERLSAEPDMRVVATAHDADEAVTRAVKHRPDIILLDIEMPGLLVFDAARTIRSLCPHTRIVFLSAFYHDRYVEQALSIECAGYLTKNETAETVVDALRIVSAQGVYFSPQVRAQIVVGHDGPRLAHTHRSRTDRLTPRETEVLRYIASGLSKKDMAQLMRLSIKTVDRHAATLMAKLDIHDRVGLARFAIREGLARA